MRILAAIGISIIILAGCSGDDPVVVMKWTDGFFPMEPGDTWYYTIYDENGVPVDRITREAGEVRDFQGILCTPIYDDNGLREQCWTKDSTGFSVHLFLYYYVPDPPLLIPFDLRSDRPYLYDSFAEMATNPSQGIRIRGKMTLAGYVPRSVPAGSFKNCLKLRYDEEGEYRETYYEYYAPGVGLIDDGTIILDSAIIGGVRYGMD